MKLPKLTQQALDEMHAEWDRRTKAEWNERHDDIGHILNIAGPGPLTVRFVSNNLEDIYRQLKSVGRLTSEIQAELFPYMLGNNE